MVTNHDKKINRKKLLKKKKTEETTKEKVMSHSFIRSLTFFFFVGDNIDKRYKGG